jgi:hypothetical protein
MRKKKPQIPPLINSLPQRHRDSFLFPPFAALPPLLFISPVVRRRQMFLLFPFFSFRIPFYLCL